MITTLVLWSTLASAVTRIDCRPQMTSRATVTDHFDRAVVGISPESALHDVRPMFAGSFTIDSLNGARMFDRARSYLLERMSRMHKTMTKEDRRIIADALRPPRSAATVVMIDPFVLRLVLAEPSGDLGARRFASFVERFDRSDPDLIWRTEVALEEDGVGVRVVARVIRWRPSGKPSRDDPPAMPLAIRYILDDPEGRARAGSSDIAPVMDLGISDDLKLAALVADTTRTLPLVFVSRRLADGESDFDISQLATDLRGFAIVASEATPGIFPWAKNGVARVFGEGGSILGRFDATTFESLSHAQRYLVDFVRYRSLNVKRVDSPEFSSIFDLLPDHDRTAGLRPPPDAP